MNSDTEAQGTPIPDAIKFLAIAVLSVVALSGFYYFSEYPLFIRIAGLLLTTVIVGYIALQTEKGRVAWGFVGDSRTEMRKVVWPTRKETLQTTLLVIALVSVVSVLIWLFDSILGWAVRLLLRQGG